MNYDITVALAKGRLSEDALELFNKCGIEVEASDSRKLFVFDKSSKYRFIFVKPSDVPVYVERGVADIGIAGKDTIMEKGKDVYEMLDLGFGKCKLCLAGFENKRELLTYPNLRVATKYINIAKKYYGELGINIDLIELNGSVELAPIIDLADIILDIVESGRTLKENGLSILNDICDVSARLIVNKASLKMKRHTICSLIESLKQQL